jgi:hypothetical protein
MFYGDNVRWFVGVITGDRDPDERGRFQVRIHGIHGPDVANSDLPWAETILPSTEGGTSGIGKIPQMLKSAMVFGIFMDGTASQHPVILGSMSQNHKPSNAQLRAAAVNGNIDMTDPENRGPGGLVITENQRKLYKDGSANTDERTLIAMDYLVNAGLPEVSAAGVVGNLLAESGLDPNIQSNVRSTKRTSTFRSNIPTTVSVDQTKEPSFGIAQWNSNVGRWQLVEKYAAKKNKSSTDLFLQLEYLVYSMKRDGLHEVWTHLSSNRIRTHYGANNENNSTVYFLTKYEKAGLYNITKREKFADKALTIYRNSVTSSAAKQVGK